MKISKQYLFYAVFFFIGWYFGLWVENWAFISLSFDVPAISLLTTFLTLCVTVYVAKIIQKSVQNRNSQNQMLIKRLDRIENLVEEIEQTTSTNGFSYIDLLAKFKNLYISSKRVIEEIFRIYPNITEHIDLRRFLLMVYEIQSDATFVSSNGGKDYPQIRIDKDCVFYTQEKRTELYSRLSILRDKLFDLQVDVNKQ